MGTDTVVLARATAFGPEAMYTFPRDDFWGGCNVRFDWFWDADPFLGQAGPSGAQVPVPRYPVVQKPDDTLMRDATGQGLRVVFGGTDFPVDPGYLKMRVRSRTFPANPPIPFFQLPAFPADFTVVREWLRPEVFVVYGGAKFLFPDPQTLMAVGFTWNDVRVIPRGGTSKLSTVPDQRNTHQGAARPTGLPRRQRATQIAALPHGPDLDLP